MPNRINQSEFPVNKNKEFTSIENDEFCVYEQKPDHHYRTELPNIIFELGLTPYDFTVYAALKRIAGDGGACWMSMPNLAKLCACSETQVKNSIKKLSGTFEKLKKPLIKITRRKLENGVNQTNVITIIDVWRENGDQFRKNNIDKPTPPLRKNGGGSHGAPYGSHGAPKEDLLEGDITTTAQESKEVVVEPRLSPGSLIECDTGTLKINPVLRDKIARGYTPEQIAHAVERCLLWHDRLSDEAALLTALRRAGEWNDTQQGYDEKNALYLDTLRSLNATSIGAATVWVGRSDIEFIIEGQKYEFLISEKDFENKVKKFMQELI